MNEHPSTTGVLAPIVKTVIVRLPMKAAFELFTAGINRWQPLATHTVGGEKTTGCVFEGKAGGCIYEVLEDGTQMDWGQVLAWEPAERVVFTLHPGRTPEYATEVEVLFQPEGSGTRVTLTHRGWERIAGLLGESAEMEYRGYEGGWDHILNRYVQSADELIRNSA